MKISMTTLALVLATSVTASAQWLYQGSESAFGDRGLHLALTANNYYGLGLRCRGKTIETVYMTPDTSFDAEGYKIANSTGPKMMICVDDGPIVELEVELIDLDGKAAAIGETDLNMFASVRDAKKRVSVVLKILDENYHEQSFSARGSGNAIKKLIAACNLEG
jgi:hypothetical protein